MNTIPEEVLWVTAITSPYTGTFYCGLELYKKIEEIIDKYPKYFPQEHIYKNIPQSVKERFELEKYDLYSKYFIKDGPKNGEGIVAYINRINEESLNKPKESLVDVVNQRIKSELEYKKELKLLHDKYFKSYGYKFTTTQ